MGVSPAVSTAGGHRGPPWLRPLLLSLCLWTQEAVTDSVGSPHDREDYVQPEKRARVVAEDLGSSKSAATESPS